MKTNTIRRFITIAAAVTITLAMGAGGAYAELKDNNNGTITDTATGLVWLKNANCFGMQNWQAATNSAAGLSSGACGLSDKSSAGQWRLPTKEELQIRSGDKTGFTNVQYHYYCYYWSSSPRAGYTSDAWFVNLGNGLVVFGYKGSSFYVWPVRAGQ